MGRMPHEPLMRGFPPEPESLVTLDNWQDPPFNRWSFQHLREVIPSQRIPAGDGPRRELPGSDRGHELDRLAVTRLDGRHSSVGDVLRETWTDSVIVVHDGQVVLERYADAMAPDSPHLLMSVSKSIVGCVAASLSDQGLLDPERLARDFVPEIAGSGYDGARVRDLLDMRTGVRFSEAYLDPEAEVRVIERHMGWRSMIDEPGGSSTGHGSTVGMYAYLATLGTEGPHGGSFVYRSADTDMLGWVCERAAGARMADLVSHLVWQPIGAEFDAEVTCDRVGTAVHDGGISATTRDVARFGLMLLDGGLVGSHPVVPEEWLEHTRTPDPDIRSAFAGSDAEHLLTGGWYRNQFWFIPGRFGDILLCLGIHGQMVFVNRSTRTVAVKMSSWPTPQDPHHLLDTVRAFEAAGVHLSGLASAVSPGQDGTGPTGVVTGR